MTRKILSILVAFISISVFSQSVELKWQDNAIITVGEDSVEVLSFEEAQYLDGTFLPYYSYSQKLTEDEAFSNEYKVSISNIVETKIGDLDLNTTLETDYKIISSVSASRGKYDLKIIILPFKENDGFTKLESFDLNIEKHGIIRLKSATPRFAPNSVLATGNWYKVGVKKTGIYKLTYSEIRGMGLDPSKISVFTGQAGKLSTLIQDYVDDLKETPIYDGGDYILFYAQEQDIWEYNSSSQRFEHKQQPYWNESYYFLSDNVGDKKRIATATAITDAATTTFDSYVVYDAIEPQVENIDHSGDDWYSEIISNGNSFEHTFRFDNVRAETASMEMRMAARTIGSSHQMRTYIDGNQKGIISLSTTSDGATAMAAYETKKVYSFVPQGNSIEAKMLFSTADPTGKSFIDYFWVNAVADLKMESNSLLFRNKVVNDTVVEYQLSNATASTVVWDVMNPYDVKQIPAQLSGSTLSFKAYGNTLNQYAALNYGASFSSPRMVGKVDNQDLHGMDIPDMVIVTIAEFAAEAENIAEIHRKEGLDITVVNQQDIFTEYSGGKADVTAIRWFFKSLYDRDPEKFKYALLLGDADVNNRLYEDGSSLVMAYESNESLNRSTFYVSDDYFGLLDDNEGNGSNIELTDRVDIGIGRIPVESNFDIQTVTTKINKYIFDSKKTSWKNTICLVADDQDNNTHVGDANKLADKIRREHPAFAVKKVFLDAFLQEKLAEGNRYPSAKVLIDKYINEGVLIWSYTGHGSPTALAEEGVMHINDVNSYKNMANLPLWLTATCDFCPYDHNEEISSGERVLMNPLGGGIGLFTTTRLVYSSSNYVISNNFYSYILNTDNDGEKLRLGDVVRLTKQATGTGANKRKFALIGDPALQLIHAGGPKDVVTDSINGIVIDEFTDTLQALSTVSVSGYIQNTDGSIDNDYNGILYPTVYDKISNLKTLGNDSDSEEMEFVMWSSILFKGKTEVINGRFTFEFLLPKDLDYTTGKGRIEYYVTSDQGEVNGYFEDFKIGGFYEGFEADNEGPSITAYMNSSHFKNGDIVNPNPVLIAEITDASGINTSGNSIGHDITVKLNNDPSTIENINSNYVSKVGNYREGIITYPIKDLDEGEYTLSLKVWDMQNNSSTVEVNFEVKDNSKPDISALYCYPNPVSISSGESVRFVATHDRPESTIGVKLNLYDGSGRILYESKQYSGTQNNEIYFDWTPGESNWRTGLYFYRITITDEDGKESTGQSKKLLLVQ